MQIFYSSLYSVDIIQILLVLLIEAHSLKNKASNVNILNMESVADCWPFKYEAQNALVKDQVRTAQ